MRKVLLPFSETHQFSSLVDDYLSGNEKLKPFYKYAPAQVSFAEAIKNKQATGCDRKVLHKSLIQQYGTLLNEKGPGEENTSEVINSLLSENTFTVTTGHQLNIFTGPLYAIYKIASTIKLARELKKTYPENTFVPVFWMASEDHDFEEINHIRIFGKTLTWEKKSGGPVGKFSTEGLPELVAEIRTLVGVNHNLLDLFDDVYRNSKNLADATRQIIHSLFGKYGLVIVDGNDKNLKALFVPEMKSELEEQKSFTAMQQTNKRFAENYKIQVQPREINLFYMEDELRERIVKNSDGSFSVNNTELNFTGEEILNLLISNPEKFSPNVVMRPVYQEKILPNLAYIGGPGELNYWLQFMSTFEVYNIPFPVLMLRNCMMWIDKPTQTKIEKLGLSINEIYQSSEYLLLKILENSSEIHPGTDHQAAAIQKVFAELAHEYSKLDASLVPSVEGEKQKVLNGLKTLEEKARRSLKKKNETVVNQLKNLKEKLIPGGTLQERTDNFIPFYINFEGDFINEIIEQTDPFINQFINLIEE